MTDRYEEWRDFYSKRVSSWMSLEELRAECGKLTTTDGTSPELLLIHAMHALEGCEQRNEALLRQALEALIWTTGSEDFGEGGLAREGALKLLFPTIAALRERLSKGA